MYSETKSKKCIHVVFLRERESVTFIITDSSKEKNDILVNIMLSVYNTYS